MRDGQQPTESARRPKTGQRWHQFGLRSLLVFTGVLALGAAGWRAYVAPYVQQRQTVGLIKELGGNCQTSEASVWLRRLSTGDFQNITHVNLADCDDPR